MLFYFRKLKTYAQGATHTHFFIYCNANQSIWVFVVSVWSWTHSKRENLRDMLTKRSLRLAIDSIFSIILLFSDRIFILIWLFFLVLSFTRKPSLFFAVETMWSFLFTVIIKETLFLFFTDFHRSYNTTFCKFNALRRK